MAAVRIEIMTDPQNTTRFYYAYVNPASVEFVEDGEAWGDVPCCRLRTASGGELISRGTADSVAALLGWS